MKFLLLISFTNIEYWFNNPRFNYVIDDKVMKNIDHSRNQFNQFRRAFVTKDVHFQMLIYEIYLRSVIKNLGVPLKYRIVTISTEFNISLLNIYTAWEM